MRLRRYRAGNIGEKNRGGCNSKVAVKRKRKTADGFVRKRGSLKERLSPQWRTAKERDETETGLRDAGVHSWFISLMLGLAIQQHPICAFWLMLLFY